MSHTRYSSSIYIVLFAAHVVGLQIGELTERFSSLQTKTSARDNKHQTRHILYVL